MNKLLLLTAATLTAFLVSPVLSAENPEWRAGAKNVLVVYAADDKGGNLVAPGDSRLVAEYYAQRRGVPAENLLGLKLQREKGKTGTWKYAEFYDLILKPVAEKLHSKAADGTAFSDRVCYIVLCPGVPTVMDIRIPGQKKGGSFAVQTNPIRSVDNWLVAVDANLKAGVNAETGTPGPSPFGGAMRMPPAKTSAPAATRGGSSDVVAQATTTPAPASAPVAPVLGQLMPDIILNNLFGRYGNPAQAEHFRQLRSGKPDEYDYYLVSRLGLDLATARDMLDGSLYAERFLRLPEEKEKTDYRPHIWLDGSYGFAQDQLRAMSRCVAVVQGVKPSPFAEGKGLQRVWPLVIDKHPDEIGKVVNGVQHKPALSIAIAPKGVDEEGVTLVDSQKYDVPYALYFPVGCKVTCRPPPLPKPASAPASGRATAATRATAASSAAAPTPSTTTAANPGAPGQPVARDAEPVPTATVVGLDAEKKRILLSTTKGFKPGWNVVYEWPGEFPADDCFYFFGFYGLGQYEDVFKFPPGALGIHVDSACDRWARGAIGRGIAATFGVVTEPFSAGIPYGDQVILALSGGYDWAEAIYGGTQFGHRWTGLVYGDPLYAPFRSKMIVATAPPVIGEVKAETIAPSAPKPPAGSRPAAPAPPATPAGVSVDVAFTAELAGKSEDELADVALFKLEYGPTTRYGQTIEFFDWPDPEKSKDVKGRRFGYSRHFRAVLKGLEKGKECHYRLTARNPAALETVATDAVFTP